MWKRIFSGLYLVHVALLIIGAYGFFKFWRRTRFWLPKYIHVLAAIGFLLMLWVLSMAPADAPVNRWGPVPRFLFALVLPAIIYFFFVFYGGQRVAFDRSVATKLPCPFCGNPVPAHPVQPGSTLTTRFLEPVCNQCGQALPT
jgi:hypothetical protein